MYEKALIAQDYYRTNNTEIGSRMGYLERQMRNKIKVKFHRLRNAFFPKATKRLVLYLMGNGATFDDQIKAKIDRKFDNTMIIGAINACVDGVVWGFPDLNSLTFFRATEFVPLVDERTDKLMAGIRFWQIDSDKPMYIELYEIEGITEYKATKNIGKIEETSPIRKYKQTVRQDEFTITVIDGENYGVLPIFPLYANELGTSELTTGLKALIDAYDFISSDLVDGITLLEGLYGIVKNYSGQDAQQLLAEIHQLKTLLNDGDNAEADLKAVELPFEAKKMALDLLERRMYDDFLLPDSTNDGRAITATEIKAAREDMDIKADLLEWQVAEFIENVLRLKGNDEPIPNYKRRTLVNDTESVTNIATSMAGAPWRTYKDAIMDDPTIPQDEKEERIKAIDLSETGVPPEEEEIIET